MHDDNKRLEMVQNLVGEIAESHLKYVDYYVSEGFGIFIPTVGFCEYAIMPQHTHPSYSFVLFFSKEQDVFPPKIEIKPNHYLITSISPLVPHEEKKTDMFTRYIVIFISEELYKQQYQAYSDKEPEKYLFDQYLIEHDIMHYLKKFMSEYESNSPGKSEVLNALGCIITNQLIRGMLNVDIKNNMIIDKFEIEKIIEYMHQHFGDKLSNATLAKMIDMSESHFIRTFKKETGMSPMGYLMKIRIDKAKKLLQSGEKNITEVSLICGFNSTSHFSSSFTKYMGMTPSEYQKLGRM